MDVDDLRKQMRSLIIITYEYIYMCVCVCIFLYACLYVFVYKSMCLRRFLHMNMCEYTPCIPMYAVERLTSHTYEAFEGEL